MQFTSNNMIVNLLSCEKKGIFIVKCIYIRHFWTSGRAATINQLVHQKNINYSNSPKGMKECLLKYQFNG